MDTSSGKVLLKIWLYRYCISILAVFGVSGILSIIVLHDVSTLQMILPNVSIGRVLESNNDNASLGGLTGICEIIAKTEKSF